MVIFYARYEARQFGSDAMETEHLLLGLLREDADLVDRLLSDGNTADTIRARIVERTPKGEATPTSVDLRLSESCKRILTAARDESDRRKHDFIGTEHLLLGFVKQDSDPAAKLLLKMELLYPLPRRSCRRRRQTICELADRSAIRSATRSCIAFSEHRAAGRGARGMTILPHPRQKSEKIAA